ETQTPSYLPISGLNLTLPAASSGAKTALIILDLPNPYAKGTNFPGALFGIGINGTILAPLASFTSDLKNPESPGRKPTTLVVRVTLNGLPQSVQAFWQPVRNSTVVIDSPATMSAIIAD